VSAPNSRFVTELASQLREVDFSWFELDSILRRAVRKALSGSGTKIVDKSKKQTPEKQMRMEL
jgi:hypothetical protein